jgi:cellulose synthase/poly-beta-1,6-N-acetylglucosamine synthase-like glycosyltransferase
MRRRFLARRPDRPRRRRLEPKLLCAGFLLWMLAAGYGGAVEVFLLSCAWLVVVFSLTLRALHQRSLFQAVAISPPPVSNAPRVAFIIPARDEEDNIGSCLGSLLVQNYPVDRFNVLVVDDRSSNGLDRQGACPTQASAPGAKGE